MAWKLVRTDLVESGDSRQRSRFESGLRFTYALLGLVVGGGLLIGAVCVTVCSAPVNITFELQIFSGAVKVLNAAPGTVLLVAGLAVLWITRFRRSR